MSFGSLSGWGYSNRTSISKRLADLTPQGPPGFYTSLGYPRSQDHFVLAIVEPGGASSAAGRAGGGGLAMTARQTSRLG